MHSAEGIALSRFAAIDLAPMRSSAKALRHPGERNPNSKGV
jgi:hypothetical protein